jgi:prepilin-type processing-associated H-X9-DG protein
LALLIYSESNDAFPPYDSGTNNWWRMIELPLNQTTRVSVARCPLGKGWRLDDGTVNYPELIAYSYNAWGIVGVGSSELALGLGGTVPLGGRAGRPAKPGMVRAPSNMLAVGDSSERSLDPIWDGYLTSGWFMPMAVGDRRISPPPSPTNPTKEQPTYKSHRGRFNRGYADGHVESENFNRPIKDTDEYWSRYNIDNEAHRDLWQKSSRGL